MEPEHLGKLLQIKIDPKTSSQYDVVLDRTVTCRADTYIIRPMTGKMPDGVTGVQVDDNNWVWVGFAWEPLSA